MSQAMRQIQEKIIQWLENERLMYDVLHMDEFTFSMVIHPNEGQNVNLVLSQDQPEKVMLGSRSNITESEKVVFNSLPDIEKKSFLTSLQLSLIQINLLFEIKPDPPLEVDYIEMKKPIYLDGLTRDKFFDCIFTVMRGLTIVRLNYDSLAERAF
jgi:hypothetical protein